MEFFKLKIEGHVLIKDFETGQVLVNKRNAIHDENMITALASSLTNSSNSAGLEGFIYSLRFGNGGVVVDSSGNVTYNDPNVENVTDTLHNETYSKVVDFDISDDPLNNTEALHTGGTTFSNIVVTSTLDYNEPTGQDALDDTLNQEGDYVFDEIGLMSQQGRLLTHLIFHPVQKSANRKIQVIYTIRLSAG